MLATTSAPTSRIDRVGIAASLLCALHCLVAPIVLIGFPAFAPWWSEPWVHALAALVVVPVAIIGLQLGHRRHGRQWPRVLGWLGCALLLVALLPAWTQVAPLVYSWGSHTPTISETYVCCPQAEWGAQGGMISIPWPTALSIVGSLFLIVGHCSNACCKQCCKQC